MSPRRWDERIQDILLAINEIRSFVANVEFADFRDDLKTVRAVELNFIIIGEAAGAVPEEIQEKHPEIPWNLMRGMRNRLVHTYFSMSPQIIWDTIQQDLPPLVDALEHLLKNPDQ